jgi:hypothetical protein
MNTPPPIIVPCRYCDVPQTLTADRIRIKVDKASFHCGDCGRWFDIRWLDAVRLQVATFATEPPHAKGA